MAKTRSQNLHSSFIKEEGEKKPKLHPTLNDTHKTKMKKTQRVKSRAIKTETKSSQTKTVNVKSESKDELLSSLAKTDSKEKWISKEQIAKLIGYLVNDRMTIFDASQKTGMGYTSAKKYYQAYKDDPAHRVPLPKMSLRDQLTQDKVDNLINYIVNEKLDLTQAAYKAEIPRSKAVRYYEKYLGDPARKMPSVDIYSVNYTRGCSQKQINDLISYIVKDKMTVTAAARKASIYRIAAKKIYLKYLKDPNREIPLTGKFSRGRNKTCTNDEVKTLIDCIVNKGMTLLEASANAFMSDSTGRKYYKQYLNDPEHKIPTPESTPRIHGSKKKTTLDQAKSFFHSILVSRMTIDQAALEANMPLYTGYRLYKKYLINSTEENEAKDTSYTPEKMKKMIKYIQKDNMNTVSAAKKANLYYPTALKYYRQYLTDPQKVKSKAPPRKYNWMDVKKLIGYIEDDKMTVCAAARKANMSSTCAFRYHKKYKDDPEHKVPFPLQNGKSVKQKQFDQYMQIVTDIYENNPGIKPEMDSDHCTMDGTDINIKQEHFERNEESKRLIPRKKK